MSDIKSEGFFLFGTDWILEQWIRWSRVNHGVSSCFKSREPFARLLGGGLPTPCITDDDAIIVDRLVSQMRASNELMGDAVIYYFSFSSNLSRVCRKMRISRRHALSLINLGIAHIDHDLRSSSYQEVDKPKKLAFCVK